MPAPRAAARTFQDLVVWRKAHELVLAVYSFKAAFPKQETYGLTLQMRRAAVSVPADIAEGFRRRGNADKARYMNYGRGFPGGESLLLDPGERPRIRRHQQSHNFTGRSQPLAQRLCVCHSGFGLLTPDFHIPQGYQGRSPCLVRVKTCNVKQVLPGLPLEAAGGKRRHWAAIERPTQLGTYAAQVAQRLGGGGMEID